MLHVRYGLFAKSALCCTFLSSRQQFFQLSQAQKLLCDILSFSIISTQVFFFKKQSNKQVNGKANGSMSSMRLQNATQWFHFRWILHDCEVKWHHSCDKVSYQVCSLSRIQLANLVYLEIMYYAVVEVDGGSTLSFWTTLYFCIFL